MESKPAYIFSAQERKLLNAAAVGMVSKYQRQLEQLYGGGKNQNSLTYLTKANELLDSITMGASKVEDIGEVKHELSKVVLPSDFSSDQAQSDPAQELARVRERIKALEEYNLKADHLRHPPPAALSYLFVKSQGKIDFQDENPSPLLVRFIKIGERRPNLAHYEYEGGLVNGLPSGKGKITYGNFYMSDDEHYACSYEGSFLNGLKHGPGRAVARGHGKAAEEEEYQEDCRYSQGKKSGIFKETSKHQLHAARTKTQIFVNDLQQLVSIEIDGEERKYQDMKDGRIDGHEIVLNEEGDKVTVTTYKEGKPQGEPKIYVLA